jgi:putative transposase
MLGQLAVTDGSGPHHRFEVPEGYVAKGFSFEVEWPEQEDRASLVRSHLGARRFAFNWALGQVESDMDAKSSTPALSRWAGTCTP